MCVDLAGHPSGSVGKLEIFWRRDVSSNLGVVTRTGIFPHKINTNNAQQVENEKMVGRQNSTSRSPRERNGCILLARNIKASTAEGRWRIPV